MPFLAFCCPLTMCGVVEEEEEEEGPLGGKRWLTAAAAAAGRGGYSRAIDFDPEPGPRSRNCVVRFSLSFFAMSTFCRNLLSWKERGGIISSLVKENFRFPRKFFQCANGLARTKWQKIFQNALFAKMTSVKCCASPKFAIGIAKCMPRSPISK